MQDRKLLYVRESYFSQDILPADVSRPLHDDDDEDDEDEAAELEGPDVDDEDFDEDMDDDE